MRPKKTAYDDPRRCEKCAHYVQHYVLNNERTGYRECCCGSCTQSRFKIVIKDRTCEAFREQNPGEQLNMPIEYASDLCMNMQ